MSNVDPAVLRWEVIKLLVQLVWADHVIHAAEREVIRSIAQRWNLSPQQLRQVDDWLAGVIPLSLPDIQVLRPHKQHVMELARTVIRVDQKIEAEEQEALAQIEKLLS